jgi:hypothetical protein
MSHQKQVIEKLSQERSREVQCLLNQVLNTSFLEDLSRQLWLDKREDWVAVPTVSEDAFRSAILRIAECSEYQELLGVFLDTYPDKPIVFSIPANIDGVSEFDVEPPPGFKVIFAGAPDWVVLNAESELCIVAGPNALVERFLSTSISQSLVEFNSYLESWEAPTEFADILQSLKKFPLTIYRNILENYQNASVGTKVNLLAPIDIEA